MKSDNQATPDSPSGPVTCLLLAGGASTRMKQNKAFLPVGPQSMVKQLINSLQPIMYEIIICCVDPVPFSDLGVRLAIDRFKGEGPMLAIEAGLCISKTDLNFVIACDIPELDWALWQNLYLLAQKADIVVPQYADGHYEPLFAFYHRQTLSKISSLIDQGERQILQVYPLCRTIPLPLPNGYQLWNLNTQEEYKRYLSSRNLPPS